MTGCLLLVPDLGRQNGLGHFMRCLALAQAWEDRGGSAVFALSSAGIGAQHRLSDVWSAIRWLPPDELGRASAERVREMATEARVLVLDSYHLDAEYLASVRGAGRPICLVDDDGRGMRFHPDFLLNHNPYATARLYPCPHKATILLAGPDYTLLRRSFAGARREHETKAEVEEVLITVGGGSSGRLGSRIADIVDKAFPSGSLRITLAGGVMDPQADARRRSGRSRRLSDVWDLSRYMAGADLAVAAAGVTSWELAYVGVPTVLVVRAANQRPVAEYLTGKGAAVMGSEAAVHLAAERLAGSLHALRAHSERKDLSQRARTIMDGYGRDRAAMVLDAGGVRLRDADKSDATLLWRWANEPLVRRNSFQQRQIPWAEHVEWYRDRLEDPGTRIYIAVDAEERPAGQVRIQCDKAQEAVVSCLVEPKHRGMGIAAEMLRLAAARFRAAASTPLHAYVKTGNRASARAFRAAGYRMVETVSIAGQSAEHLLHVRHEQ